MKKMEVYNVMESTLSGRAHLSTAISEIKG